MYVDVKYTIWDRLHIQHKEREDFLNLAEAEQISHPQDIYDNMSDVTTDTMMETAEFITTEENGNQSTMEVYNESGKLLWSNAPAEGDQEHLLRKFMKLADNHLDLDSEKRNFLKQIARDLYNETKSQRG